eukprot:gene7549-10287_t
MLSYNIILVETKRYNVLEYSPQDQYNISIEINKNDSTKIVLCMLNLNCKYTANVVLEAFKKRIQTNNTNYPDSRPDSYLQLGDFENINWDDVMARKSSASSYLVRKGLSRKAQLALQIKKYTCKRNHSILKLAVPETIIIETWSAFENMKLDFGQ